ncbi:hypothetical protein DL240_15285 [Lujinxingia litoralis]|uniref:Uncharacterized protein n=1 Tax=Lujinxingia litoralis TaxID=2211119 RepID=A0A328C406_9DELT|nr:DUF4397 domain-containing protein [Lujinxingia litoralis]RAL20679.1 hypothetical protein DL240_15285 [Lujinxingia litoralis]
MKFPQTYSIRLLLGALLASGLLACGGDEAEQGVMGPAGPAGEQGEPGEQGDPGEPGTDGVDGSDGQNGQDNTLNSLVTTETVEPGEVCAYGGVIVSTGLDANENGELDTDEIAANETICAGEPGPELCDESLAITGISGLEQDYYTGIESAPITVETNATEGISLAFIGQGASFEAAADGTFTATPNEVGDDLRFVLVAAGQCGTAVANFTLTRVDQAITTLHFVHLDEGLGPVEVMPSGSTTSLTSLEFGNSEGAIDLEPGTYSFDLIDNGTLAASTPSYDYELNKAYTVVAYPATGGLSFLILEDDLTAAPADAFRARFIHTAELAGNIAISAGPDADSLSEIATGVPFEDVGDFTDYLSGLGALQIDSGGTLLTYATGVSRALTAGDIANVFAFQTQAGNVRLLVQYLHTTAGEEATLKAGGAVLFDFEDGILPPEFISSGDLAWEVDSDPNVTLGDHSLVSGPIGDSSRSELGIDLEFTEPGTFSFDWKVSSEPRGASFYDGLIFCDALAADCTPYPPSNKARLEGEEDWTTVSYEIPAAGTYTFSWTYRKDISNSVGEDRGWLDNLSFVPPEPSLL